MNLQDLQRVIVQDAKLRDDGVTWEIWVEEQYKDGTSRSVVNVLPADTPSWRAAEYGLDPADLDTLVDIMLIERYIDPAEMQRDTVPVWNAPTLEEARNKLMSLVTETKLKFRISTRGTDHPMRKIKESPATRMDPADLGLKALGVVATRHHMGVQKLDKDVATAIDYIGIAIAQSANSSDHVSNSPKSRP